MGIIYTYFYTEAHQESEPEQSSQQQTQQLQIIQNPQMCNLLAEVLKLIHAERNAKKDQ